MPVCISASLLSLHYTDAKLRKLFREAKFGICACFLFHQALWGGAERCEKALGTGLIRQWGKRPRATLLRASVQHFPWHNTDSSLAPCVHTRRAPGSLSIGVEILALHGYRAAAGSHKALTVGMEQAFPTQEVKSPDQAAWV